MLVKKMVAISADVKRRQSRKTWVEDKKGKNNLHQNVIQERTEREEIG